MRTWTAPGAWSRRECLAGLGALVLGLGSTNAAAAPEVQRRSRSLLGTQLDITVDHADQALGAFAIEAAFAEMQRLEGLLSHYREDSELGALRRAAGRQALAVSPELWAVLRRAETVSAFSDGAFDATVGAYSGWDFAGASRHLPSSVELAAERRLVNYRDVVLERGGGVRLRKPGMRLDLGGIAKLPILQAGQNVLRHHGIRNAMLNGGGDVLCCGQLQGRDWRVGLRDPRAPQKLLLTIALRDGVVASSGDYLRCFWRDGRRYHHVLDPRTGLPSGGVHGVTLIANHSETVNGLGAAIMVAGAVQGRHLIANTPGMAGMIVSSDSTLWQSADVARLRVT